MKLIIDYSKAHFPKSSYAAVKIAKNSPTDKNINFATPLLEINMVANNAENKYKYESLYQKDWQLRNNNPTLDFARDILKQVRSIYKGSNCKSSNKLRMNSSLNDRLECQQNINKVQSGGTYYEWLVNSVKLKTGNCGEMAWIAYALSHHGNLSPKLNYYKTPGTNFEHGACQVVVDGKEYIIDPWANLFCEKKDYIQELVNKVKQWEEQGKIVTCTGTPYDIKEAYRDPSTLGSAKVTIDQVSNLELIRSSKMNGEHNIVSPDFFSLLKSIGSIK